MSKKMKKVEQFMKFRHHSNISYIAGLNAYPFPWFHAGKKKIKRNYLRLEKTTIMCPIISKCNILLHDKLTDGDLNVPEIISAIMAKTPRIYTLSFW